MESMSATMQAAARRPGSSSSAAATFVLLIDVHAHAACDETGSLGLVKGASGSAATVCTGRQHRSGHPVFLLANQL